MGKKILILTSSPRKNGNTNTIAQWCAQSATDAGANVECIDIARLNYKSNGCISCYSCQQSDKYECSVKDDANDILERMDTFDVIVYSTPTYMFGPSAQLKLLLDRTFSLVKFDPESGDLILKSTGQAMALIATAGGGIDDGLSLTDKSFKSLAAFLGTSYLSLLIPEAPSDPKDLQEKTELKQKAVEFGRVLAG
ncbi:MAG: flavodoxin family protein [Planctomycetota bacterium]|jgi:multimeric flavodoxin WrbA